MEGSTLAVPWGDTQKRIVELHFLLGMPLGEIAGMLKVSKRTVKDVIEDPRTEELVAKVRDRMTDMQAENLAEQVKGRIDSLRVSAAGALQKTLTHDIHPLHKAKPNQDRVALKLLQGTGDLRDRSEEQKGGITLTETQFDRLLEGLTKADRVREIQVATGPVVDAEIEEEDVDD